MTSSDGAVRVRHSEERDLETIRRLYAQPDVYASTLQLPFPSAESWKARLSKSHEHFYSLLACDGEDVLGHIGIEQLATPRRRHVANIGIAVFPQARGIGIGGALLEAAIELCEGWLGVTRIELEVYTDNAAAIALYQRYRFRIEGTASRYALRAGEYADVHLMARLKND